jgi:hypothetical protein
LPFRLHLREDVFDRNHGDVARMPQFPVDGVLDNVGDVLDGVTSRPAEVFRSTMRADGISESFSFTSWRMRSRTALSKVGNSKSCSTWER